MTASSLPKRARRGHPGPRSDRGIALLTAILLAILALGAVSGCGDAREEKGTSMLSMSSPAFESGGQIPAEHATTRVAGGANTSIPYEWRNPPADTKSFALELIDRAPVARDWVHWIVCDIPPSTTALSRGASPSGLPPGAVELTNTFGRAGYDGPQPPPGTGKHPYEATLYALDLPSLSLSPSADRTAFERAVQGHVLGTASVTGFMGR